MPLDAARSRRPDLPATLAAAILERARAEGLGAGAHLPEAALAESLRVSRTPVRAALRLLEERGVVESRPHRGCFLLRPPPSAASSPATADEEVYLRIAGDRLNGRLPSRVRESDLARRYGIARPNLLRLLARMAREGWVERLPGHGWEFGPILDSARAYEQSYRFRILIEPAALREPGYRPDPGLFGAVRERQRAILDGLPKVPSAVELFEASAAFHEAIVAGSGNPLLLDAVRRVNRLRRLLEYRAPREPERIAEGCRANLRMLDLLEAGKNARAATILERHLRAASGRKAGAAPDAPPPGAAPSTRRR